MDQYNKTVKQESMSSTLSKITCTYTRMHARTHAHTHLSLSLLFSHGIIFIYQRVAISVAGIWSSFVPNQPTTLTHAAPWSAYTVLPY